MPPSILTSFSEIETEKANYKYNIKHPSILTSFSEMVYHLIPTVEDWVRLHTN